MFDCSAPRRRAVVCSSKVIGAIEWKSTTPSVAAVDVPPAAARGEIERERRVRADVDQVAALEEAEGLAPPVAVRPDDELVHLVRPRFEPHVDEHDRDRPRGTVHECDLAYGDAADLAGPGPEPALVGDEREETLVVEELPAGAPQPSSRFSSNQ